MAKLTRKQTLHIASLAKLNLTNQEVNRFSKQLSEVLDYISELDEIDTKSVVPTSQTTGLTNVLRNDEIHSENCLTQHDALSGTDSTKSGFFEVPAILTKNE